MQPTHVRSAVRKLADLGPLPSADDATEEALGRWQRAFEAIERPLCDDEARLLLDSFGPDDCYGLAWSLLHLIETAPTSPLVSRPAPNANPWHRLMWRRLRFDTPPLRHTARSAGMLAQIDGAESDYIMAGWSEHEDGSGHGMTISCMLAEPDAGTAEQGMDSYCMSTEWGWSVYGGLQAVRLKGGELMLEFDADDAFRLGLDNPMVIVDLAVDAASIAQLREGLHRTLRYGRPRSRPAIEEL